MRYLGLALLMVGLVGCGGSLTGGGPDATGAGGSTGTGNGGGSGDGAEKYVWGDVGVLVGPAYIPPANQMVLQMFDPLHPGQPGPQMTYPAATRLGPSNGASIIANYTCSSPGLYEIEVRSCAEQPGVKGGVDPGCTTAIFRPEGIAGEFVDANGAPCRYQSGIANIDLPFPWIGPVDVTAPFPAGDGRFLLDCALADGTIRQLEAVFILPVESWTLLCQR